MPACCRSLAVKRRNALLLYEYSRNAAGLPMPGTQRHFKLSANPRQIGQESVGLGVYLTSVIMYMGILFVLALLMIYLTVDNSQQNGYTQTYTSFVNNVSWPGLWMGHPNTVWCTAPDVVHSLVLACLHLALVCATVGLFEHRCCTQSSCEQHRANHIFMFAAALTLC